MKIKLLLVLFLTLLFIGRVGAIEEKKVVRVGISNQNFSSYEHDKVKISSSDVIKIVDMSQNVQLDLIEPFSVIQVVVNNFAFDIYVNNEIKYEKLQGPLIFGSNENLEIQELNRKGNPAKYKGLIELRFAKNGLKFHIINVVDMQNYLRGVVPNEMPVSFGLEALKAQSVAARNYATNAQISPYYDVADSTASQVYYGVNSYRDVSDMAVFQTQGIYALYNEKPITALYFSTSSGITDDWDDVFSNGTYSAKHPYLKARYDLDNKPLKNEQEVKEFYSKKDNGLDTNSPKFRWEIEFSRTELEEVLHTTLQQQSKAGCVSPFYDGDIKLEGLKEIKAIKRTQSGKVIELEIIAKSGDYKIKNQLAIRRIFKKNGSMLPSTNFFVEPSKEEEKLSNESEETGLIKIFDFSFDEKYPKSFKFIGGGFGHGVGMSQFGAYNLAKAGKKYPDILNHYYSDIVISTIPKEVEYNEYNLEQKTEFYFDREIFDNVYLFINNTRNVSEFPFKINDLEFSETKDIANKGVIKINITQYLKQGQNVISFLPLSKENKNKFIIYRVEFQQCHK